MWQIYNKSHIWSIKNENDINHEVRAEISHDQWECTFEIGKNNLLKMIVKVLILLLNEAYDSRHFVERKK